MNTVELLEIAPRISQRARLEGITYEDAAELIQEEADAAVIDKWLACAASFVAGAIFTTVIAWLS